jgi:hypothetical protein
MSRQQTGWNWFALACLLTLVSISMSANRIANELGEIRARLEAAK